MLPVAGPTAAKGGSIVASIGLPLVLLAIFGALFVLRSMAPRGMMKIGISMLQIVARYALQAAVAVVFLHRSRVRVC